jgi:hypothetical protein
MKANTNLFLFETRKPFYENTLADRLYAGNGEHGE